MAFLSGLSMSVPIIMSSLEGSYNNIIVTTVQYYDQDCTTEAIEIRGTASAINS